MKTLVFVLSIAFAFSLTNCGRDRQPNPDGDSSENSPRPVNNPEEGDSPRGDTSGLPQPNPVQGDDYSNYGDCAQPSSGPEEEFMSEALVDVTVNGNRFIATKKDRYLTLRQNTAVSPSMMREYSCERGSVTCVISARAYLGRSTIETLACDYLENGKVLDYARNENRKCEEDILENKRQELEDKGYQCR